MVNVEQVENKSLRAINWYQKKKKKETKGKKSLSSLSLTIAVEKSYNQDYDQEKLNNIK